MAIITIPSTKKQITEPAQIAAFLEPFGIWYEKWDVGTLGEADPDQTGTTGQVMGQPTADEVLKTFEEPIRRLKARGGYVTADVINVNSQTANLEAMLAKFSREHTHAEDEVRFIVQGRGVFHINPARPGALVFAIQVEQGDMINVPAGTRHWFDLCADRQIRAIRLFKDSSGWMPEYLENGLHAGFQPLCFSASDSAGGPAHPNRIAL